MGNPTPDFYLFAFFNVYLPSVLELAVTSHMLLHGQDTSVAQELASLHGELEPAPRFLWVGLPNVGDFFFYIYIERERLGVLPLRYQLLSVSA